MFKKLKMVLVLAITLVITACNCSLNEANASGLGNYSNGYRMGQISKFSVKGWTMKSGEGQMLMGADSTPYIVGEGKNKKRVNPWYFSSLDKKIQKKINNKLGDYAVLGYNQAHVKFPNVDTEYEITSVSNIGSKQSESCVAKAFTNGSNSDGKRTGRIVKASSKGTFTNSFEIMLQQGNSGNQFKNMSISKDVDLYNCAVRYLKAGQTVKITYVESIINLNLAGRETNYDIVKIEPIVKATLN